MKSHALIGRFDSSDRDPVSTSANETPTQFSLVGQNSLLEHGMGQALRDLSQLNLFPTEIGVDLMVLAAHVHAADTRISRATESQDSWTREIRLVVPVSDTTLWGRTNTVLERILNFLTGDKWQITFRQRPQKFARLSTPRCGQPQTPRFDSLELFSGGLDSLIAAIDSLENGRVPLLVSHAGEPATSHAQRTCLAALKQHYSTIRFERFYTWLNVPSNLVTGVLPENTTRARSFLFISLGILAATGFNGNVTLDVPENGFIALNVPLDPLRLGSYSTRTTHPFYLGRWTDLLRILGIPVTITNPYAMKTKGEMIADCANSNLLHQMIASSLSCSSPAKGRWKGHGIEHCGHCLPCLVRRGAIKHAFGTTPDPTTYSLPVLDAQILNSTQAEGEHVRSIQFALARLQANPNLSKLLIHKPGSLSDVPTDQLTNLANVYRRGLEEVGNLVASVRTVPI